MIDRLIEALNRKAGMSAEEIADMFWLAVQIQESESEPEDTDFSPGEDRNDTDNIAGESEPITSPEQQLPSSNSEETTTKRRSKEQTASIYPQKQGQISTTDLSFKAPNAPSLREPLTLARALKPLMRRVPAGTNFVLDEAATTQRIADEGLWLPVLRPTLEPWLDLELVVDESISMQIWRQTIGDLEKLLKNYGIFRDVRVWGLIADDGERVQIRRGIGARAKSQAPRSPKELIDSSGRRLVLVASDCVSPLWRDGKVTATLELWANRVPTAIIQMLPQWLWKRTALGRATEVRLRALTPGVSNQNLIAKEVSLWDEPSEERRVKVPVFTLEADKAATWAQMLSGKGSVWTSGVAFELDRTPVNQEDRLFNLDYSQLTAQQRVQAFRVTASPMARKLAGLLAAAPVITLPVVRLIREVLLKDSLQVNVAEVFLGGLLKPLSEIHAETNPDEVLYDFMDGVRELLVDSVPSGYVLNVVDEVSEHIAERAGWSLETFAAVLRNPQEVGDSRVAEEVRCFATVSPRVLRRLGGEYAKVAEELESYDTAYSQRNVQINLDSLSDIKYQVGGSLRLDSSSYVKRKADDLLYNALEKRNFCILSAPHNMGKSSLIRQLTKRLEQDKIIGIFVSLSAVKEYTEKEFYSSLISSLVYSSELLEKVKFNTKDFIASCFPLSPSNWLLNFFDEIFLKQVTEPTVIFIDEIDYIKNVDFSVTEFFSLLRKLYKKRVEDKSFNRLNFVLSGVFLDSDLIQDIHKSPFNIGVKINLEGFTYEEALPLAGGLAEKTNNPQELLKLILQWTSGQPFLTQKLCMLVKSSENYIAEGNEKAWLDNLVRTKIIQDWEEQDLPEHLRTIQRRILFKKASQLLSLYQSILQEEEDFNYENKAIRELILTGLVVKQQGRLRVANKIYAEVFNNEWVQRNLERLQLSGKVENNPFREQQEEIHTRAIPASKVPINSEFEDRDEVIASINNLALEVKKFPLKSRQRQLAFHKLVNAVNSSGRVSQRHKYTVNSELYEEALQETWLYVFTEVDKYQPEGYGSFISWFNSSLNMRLRHIIEEQNSRKTPISLDTSISSNETFTLAELLADWQDNQNDLTFEYQLLKEFIEKDPRGLLASLYVNNHPEANFRAILLKRIKNKNWQEISEDFNIQNTYIMLRFYNKCLKKFAPIFKEYLELAEYRNVGRSPEQ